MTDRQLIAYALIIAMAVAFVALIWRWRQQSQPRVYAREQLKRRKRNEARNLAQQAKADEGDRS